jgi:hypothetical protein
MGFVLRALEPWPARSLELMLERWLPMAASGTVWETWSGRHSRCHPWAAAPTAALPRLLLGVRPRGIAGRDVAVRPAYIGDWARGRVPLTYGDLAVAWQREGKQIVAIARYREVAPDISSAELLDQACASYFAVALPG